MALQKLTPQVAPTSTGGALVTFVNRAAVIGVVSFNSRGSSPRDDDKTVKNYTVLTITLFIHGIT